MAAPKDATILVIFGSMGDLAWRKLAPALYNLLLDRELPEQLAVIGLDMKSASLEEFRQRMKDGAKQFCACGKVDDPKWERIAADMAFISGNFNDPAHLYRLKQEDQGPGKEMGQAP